ncbi:hypothetical protein Tco_1063382 [Tanacetum coccineum]
MAYTSSRSSFSSDNEVYDNSFCSKSCRKNTENLNNKVIKLNEELSDCETDLYNYKRGLSQVEARLVEFKNNEIKFCERVRVLERELELRDNKIENLKNELEEDKTRIRFNEYTVVPPPPAQVYSPPKNDLSWTGGSVGNDVSKPMIRFVKEIGCPSVSKVNNTEKSRKPTVKYAKMYRSQRPRGNQRNWSRRKTMNAAKPKAVHNAVKASACWVWKPKNRVIDHVSKYNNASITLKRFDYIDTQGRFKWMHRLRGGMSMIKNLMQKLLLLVRKLMILLLKLKCTSEGVHQRQKIKKKGRGFPDQKV